MITRSHINPIIKIEPCMHYLLCKYLIGIKYHINKKNKQKNSWKTKEEIKPKVKKPLAGEKLILIKQENIK